MRLELENIEREKMRKKKSVDTSNKRASPKLSQGAKQKAKQGLNESEVLNKIALAAYYKSEARGYEPGHEIQDWLEAEAEIAR